MRNTAQTYYQDVNLADLTVSSNYGLDKNDTQTIKNQAKKLLLTLDIYRIQLSIIQRLVCVFYQRVKIFLLVN